MIVEQLGGTMASLHSGRNDKLEVLADLIYLARHSPAGAELQLRCVVLAAEVILQSKVPSSFLRRGTTEKWHLWLQTMARVAQSPRLIRNGGVRR